MDRKWEVSKREKEVMVSLIFIGLIAFVLTLITDSERAWHSYLVGFFYFVSLGIGGLFFTAIHNVARAGWITNIRRFSEALSASLPLAAFFAVIFIFGAYELYSWLDPEAVARDHYLQKKVAYLNSTFFIIRMVVFFGLWILFYKWMVGLSLRQDKEGGMALIHKNAKLGIAFLPVFALSYSFFSVDVLMSLDPHWYSTIVGVYAFAGMSQSAVAVIILLVIAAMKKNLLGKDVKADHLHDLGKIPFGVHSFLGLYCL